MNSHFKYRNPYIGNWMYCNRYEILKIITLWKTRKVITREFFYLLGLVTRRTLAIIQTCIEVLFYMMFAVKVKEMADIFKGVYNENLED